MSEIIAVFFFGGGGGGGGGFEYRVWSIYVYIYPILYDIKLPQRDVRLEAIFAPSKLKNKIKKVFLVFSSY